MRLFLPLPGLLLTLSILALPAHAQNTTLTFAVDMEYHIQQGLFDPATESVDLAGTFNNWGGNLLPLADADGDSIYHVAVPGFTASEAIEYKFRINALWEGREEFPGAGNNRRHTVGAEDDTLYHWYNDAQPPTGPPVAGFNAQPKTLYAGGQVQFYAQTDGKVSQVHWTFEGGSPATSTERNPVVSYDSPGQYAVTLVAQHNALADTLTEASYIKVVERSQESLGWWNDAVFYEIFVRSFYDSDGDGIGDFQGMIEKLDYLNDGDPNTDTDLGITGLWLMPINPTPSYHGYDVTDYKGVNPEYGSMADFKAFLSAAHERGIRVVIDYVMNHSSTQHPWFRASERGTAPYTDFYRWEASPPAQPGPWGQQVWHGGSRGNYYGLFWGGMPDLNYETPAVQDSLFEAARYWLEEVGIDGFRLDAVKYIFEEGSQLENTETTYQFWQAFNTHLKSINPESMTVGEAWTSTPGVVPYVIDDRLDYCFEFDLAGSILWAVGNADANAVRNTMATVYNSYPHLQYGTFLTNHDMNRVLDVLGDNESQLRAAAALYLTLPGVPYIYYGEEVGLLGSKPDEDIRRPMQWTAGTHAGFTTGNPWRSVGPLASTRNVETETNDPASLLSWYRRLVHLRNATPALRRGDYTSLSTSQSGQVLAFWREYEGEGVLVATNLSNSPVQGLSLTLPSGAVAPGSYWLQDELNGSGQSTELDASGEVTDLDLGPMETRVFAFANPNGLFERPTATQALTLYPNPSQGHAYIALPEGANASGATYQVVSLQGKVIATGPLPQAGLQLNTQAWPTGSYLIYAHTRHQVYAQKLVVGE